MPDYTKLAEKAKEIQDAGKLVVEAHKKLRSDHCHFFENVKMCIVEEMQRANVELRKRRAGTFEQISLPSFDDELLLTYGTDSLCRIGRGIMKGECRITASISGPPNGYELSRREYLCKKEETCREVITIDPANLNAISFTPADVAADIIAGVLSGGFQ